MAGVVEEGQRLDDLQDSILQFNVQELVLLYVVRFLCRSIRRRLVLILLLLLLVVVLLGAGCACARNPATVVLLDRRNHQFELATVM